MVNMVKSQRFAAFSLPIWAHPKGLTPTRIAHRLLKEIALERWTGDGIYVGLQGRQQKW